MEYLVGTRNGLVRSSDASVDDRLADGFVAVTTGAAGTYAHTRETCFRRTDTGWARLSPPVEQPTVIRSSQAGLYVGGTEPLAVARSTDTGRTWTVHELPSLSPATRWISGEGPTIVDEAGGRVSDIRSVDNRLLVGVERAGVFVHRTDCTHRGAGLGEDVHDLFVRTPEVWLAATGQGLYQTSNAGRVWRRLDTAQRFQQYTYYHGLIEHDGAIYTAGGRYMPGDWGEEGADCLLFRIEADGLIEANTPAPAEYIWALASTDDDLLVGTGREDLDTERGGEGVVYRREGTDWTVFMKLDASVTSIVPDAHGAAG